MLKIVCVKFLFGLKNALKISLLSLSILGRRNIPAHPYSSKHELLCRSSKNTENSFSCDDCNGIDLVFIARLKVLKLRNTSFRDSCSLHCNDL